MSGVDVLAVLDGAVEVLLDEGMVTTASSIEKARAAVAELIELAEETIDDYDVGAIWGHQIERLRAALSRVRGAE